MKLVGEVWIWSAFCLLLQLLPIPCNGFQCPASLAPAPLFSGNLQTELLTVPGADKLRLYYSASPETEVVITIGSLVGGGHSAVHFVVGRVESNVESVVTEYFSQETEFGDSVAFISQELDCYQLEVSYQSFVSDLKVEFREFPLNQSRLCTKLYREKGVLTDYSFPETVDLSLTDVSQNSLRYIFYNSIAAKPFTVFINTLNYSESEVDIFIAPAFETLTPRRSKYLQSTDKFWAFKTYLPQYSECLVIGVRSKLREPYRVTIRDSLDEPELCSRTNFLGQVVRPEYSGNVSIMFSEQSRTDPTGFVFLYSGPALSSVFFDLYADRGDAKLAIMSRVRDLELSASETSPNGHVSKALDTNTLTCFEVSASSTVPGAKFFLWIGKELYSGVTPVIWIPTGPRPTNRSPEYSGGGARHLSTGIYAIILLVSFFALLFGSLFWKNHKDKKKFSFDKSELVSAEKRAELQLVKTEPKVTPAESRSRIASRTVSPMHKQAATVTHKGLGSPVHKLAPSPRPPPTTARSSKTFVILAKSPKSAARKSSAIDLEARSFRSAVKDVKPEPAPIKKQPSAGRISLSDTKPT